LSVKQQHFKSPAAVPTRKARDMRQSNLHYAVSYVAANRDLSS